MLPVKVTVRGAMPLVRSAVKFGDCRCSQSRGFPELLTGCGVKGKGLHSGESVHPTGHID